MIVIDQYRVSDDGQTLFLDAHVNRAKYFNKIYIKRVTIVTDEQLKKYCSAAVKENYIYKETTGADDNPTREIHIVLNSNRMNENFCKKDLSHNMFFVFIEAGGTPAADTPCRLDEMTTVAVTFDYNIIYQKALCYTRQLSDSCNVPDGYIDFILKLEALHMAIETDHWMPAIDYFYMLMGSGDDVSSVKPCGCR